MQNTDLFGRDNQGNNYDKYRPKYPPIFFEMILKNLNEKKNYLDVGCGTGQMLFKLSSHFTQAIGTDISEKQISVANQKIQQNTQFNNVKVINSDANNLAANLKKYNLPQYYDLITVGQALHWFDVDNFLNEISENVLNKTQDSRFAASGYYWDGFDIDLENKIISGKDMHQEYYDSIKNYYDFDRENLYADYKYYNFQKYFQQIDSTAVVEKDSFTLEDFIKYLKTSSAYNTLIELNKNNPEFIDPTTKLQKQILEQVNLAKTNHLNDSTPFSILRRTYYFIKIFKRL